MCDKSFCHLGKITIDKIQNLPNAPTTAAILATWNRLSTLAADARENCHMTTSTSFALKGERKASQASVRRAVGRCTIRRPTLPFAYAALSTDRWTQTPNAKTATSCLGCDNAQNVNTFYQCSCRFLESRKSAKLAKKQLTPISP
jgi:hypothetical protein